MRAKIQFWEAAWTPEEPRVVSDACLVRGRVELVISIIRNTLRART